MRAADILVSKAGGLIVTESLAAGLPMLLCEVIEGQESGNADFIISQGAAVLTAEPVARLVKELSRWLKDGGKELAERKAKAQAIGLAGCRLQGRRPAAKGCSTGTLYRQKPLQAHPAKGG